MNIREIADFNPNYFEINREERNYAAILFAGLCIPGNAERFLQHFEFGRSVGPEFGIYFEYAFLRDLWSEIKDEDAKKRILQELLPIGGIDEILQMPFEEINRKFGVAGKPSSSFLQYPGKWSVRKFSQNFEDDDDFLRICQFKWSFNIKPDIVIHLDKNTAICIEAKHTSGEGSYPSSKLEKSIFRERKLNYVGQTELQKYMMENLIGVKSEFVFLVSEHETSPTHKLVTWREAFASIDMSEMPKFAAEMANAISE